MHSTDWKMALVATAVFAFVASPALADDEAPDPLKELRNAAKSLVKEAKREGYRADLQVEGGLSKKGDHSLYSMTVRENYRGDIRGNVMHVPEMKAYRTSSTGAISDGVQWYRLQSLAEGKKLDRLFAFPVQLLATALKKPEHVEWLESTEEAPEVETEESEGHTSVVKKKTQNQIYHRMRVQVPDEEALQYFIEVQNSGCLSGG